MSSAFFLLTGSQACCVRARACWSSKQFRMAKLATEWYLLTLIRHDVRSHDGQLLPTAIMSADQKKKYKERSPIDRHSVLLAIIISSCLCGALCVCVCERTCFWRRTQVTVLFHWHASNTHIITIEHRHKTHRNHSFWWQDFFFYYLLVVISLPIQTCSLGLWQKTHRHTIIGGISGWHACGTSFAS